MSCCEEVCSHSCSNKLPEVSHQPPDDERPVMRSSLIDKTLGDEQGIKFSSRSQLNIQALSRFGVESADAGII